MFLRSFAPVVIGAFLFAASPASAQSAAEKAAEKAQGGLGGYLAILAIGKLCNFDLDKPATEAIVANINALQKPAKMTDAELDQSLAALVDAFKKRPNSPCAAGANEYPAMAVAMAKGAEKEAEGSGVTLKPVPARQVAAAKAAPVKDPKEAARNMLIAAHMIEAVADECKIKITDKESLDLDRVQYYFRGKADATAAEVKEIVTVVEKEAADSRKKVCAPDWGFRSTLDTLLATIK